MHHTTKIVLSTACAVVFAAASAAPARAASLVATGGNSIWSLDSASGTPTVITTVSGKDLDSVIYANGEYVFTTAEGDIYSYDPTNGNRLLATGFGQTRDLVLDPGGSTALVSDYLGNEIYRINISTGAYSGFVAMSNPQGLAYAGNRLFALSAHSLEELDPTTGATLNSVSPLPSDGLTYDSSSGLLWTYNNQGLKSITLDLATVSTYQAGVVQPNADGIAADGLGNIYVAGQSSNIYQYVIATDTMSVGTALSGLDDIAPASGPGAPPSAPEPASALLAAGALAAVCARKALRSR